MSVRHSLAAVLVALLTSTSHGAPTAMDDRSLFTPQELAAIYRHSPMPALPPDPTNRVADDPRAARLGQYLFFDARLSVSGKVSCATCHQASLSFTDGKPVAAGAGRGTRNSPTVLNAAYNQWFFLDGRSDSLWSQALQPFESPVEMAGDRHNIVRRVAQDAAARKAYEGIFGPLPDFGAATVERQPVDRAFTNLGKAIEAYERLLVSQPAPFDRYVSALRKGDAAGQRVLSAAAKRGLKLFVGTAHCDLCHSGPLFSDGQFHNLGLAVGQDTGRAAGIALLRANPFNSTGAFSDAPTDSARGAQLSFLPEANTQLGAFKTPSLREVSRTTPYMHDGRFQTLAQVVRFYAGALNQHGATLGQRERTLDLIPKLTGAQQVDLIAFLHALGGPTLPAELTRAATLP
jgi:cytochrome c peroxidase